METITTRNRLNAEPALLLKIKLASLWASLMFVYIYVDYFHLYMPGSLKEIQQGKVYIFDISHGFLLAALLSVCIPAVMIFLSVILPAKPNRYTNIITAAIYIPYTLTNLAGTAWVHMIVGALLEVLILCIIIRYSWKSSTSMK